MTHDEIAKALGEMVLTAMMDVRTVTALGEVADAEARVDFDGANGEEWTIKVAPTSHYGEVE